jgi:hypothetical protein
VVTADIKAGQSIIHVIDKVLILKSLVKARSHFPTVALLHRQR